MKDIICTCGHKVEMHFGFQGKCGIAGCKCKMSYADVFRAHIAKTDAVVEAAKIKFMDIIREEWVDISTHAGQVALCEALCSELEA